MNCHSKIAKRAGVDLHDRATGYNDLITRNFVVPGNPTNSSALHYLLRGEGSLRMPPDAPLPEADMLLIDEWIRPARQGQHRNPLILFCLLSSVSSRSRAARRLIPQFQFSSGTNKCGQCHYVARGRRRC